MPAYIVTETSTYQVFAETAQEALEAYKARDYQYLGSETSVEGPEDDPNDGAEEYTPGDVPEGFQDFNPFTDLGFDPLELTRP